MLVLLQKQAITAAEIPSTLTPPAAVVPSTLNPPAAVVPSSLTPPPAEVPSTLTPPAAVVPSTLNPPAAEVPSTLTPPAVIVSSTLTSPAAVVSSTLTPPAAGYFTIAPVAAKIFNKLLLNRIYPHVDPLLRPNQNGFGRGRSTLPQILALRRIIEECRIGKKTAPIVFVDFSKAFDSINRDALFHILSLYRIPAPIIKAIRLLYDSAKSRVETSDGLTEFFETLISVLQGDTLAPFLFIIVLDIILRNCMSPEHGLTITPRQSRRIPAVTVTDLDFADDLALLSNTIQEAQSLLNNLEIAAEKVT
ncbi:hypothetical protein ACHWQZ_G013464 [Mnemiopsis leidyi]